jgi:putative endonuclease
VGSADHHRILALGGILTFRTLYIGVTGDLRRRIFQHKWKEYEGFSAKYNCDRLVWFEHYREVVKAIARETQLKEWNRAKKRALIERMNPSWLDLSKDWFEYEPADYKRSLDQFAPHARKKQLQVPPLPLVGRNDTQL